MISQTKERDRLEVNSTQAEISKFACTYKYWGGRQDGKVELSGVST